MTATASVEKSSFPNPASVGRLMRPLAERTARKIRDRTRRGRDVNGRPFAPLESGKKSTLERTGKMVDSFKPVSVTDRQFVLAPGRKERRKALFHQVGKGRPRRTWIGLGAEIEDEIDQVITEWMGRR